MTMTMKRCNCVRNMKMNRCNGVRTMTMNRCNVVRTMAMATTLYRYGFEPLRILDLLRGPNRARNNIFIADTDFSLRCTARFRWRSNLHNRFVRNTMLKCNFKISGCAGHYCSKLLAGVKS